MPEDQAAAVRGWAIHPALLHQLLHQLLPLLAQVMPLQEPLHLAQVAMHSLYHLHIALE